MKFLQCHECDQVTMFRFQSGTVIVLMKRYSTTWLVAVFIVLQLQVEQGRCHKSYTFKQGRRADPGFFQGGFNFSHPTHADEMMTYNLHVHV